MCDDVHTDFLCSFLSILSTSSEALIFLLSFPDGEQADQINALLFKDTPK